MYHHQDDKRELENGVKNMEKSLARLNELLIKEKITKKEFEKKKKELIFFFCIIFLFGIYKFIY